MKLQSSALAIYALLTISFLGVSCGDSKNGGERKANGSVSLGDTINVAGQPATSLLPYTINNQQSAQIGVNVLEGLTKISPEGKALPLIAESFEVDNSGLVYKFILKKGIKFHNDACFSGGEGRELNAADVIYSFQLLCKNVPENVAFSSTFQYLIEGAEDFYNGKSSSVSGFKLVDDYTLLITTTVKNETLPLLLAGIQTAIVPHEAVERYGDKATVGTGPFSVKVTDGAIKLQRNTAYYMKDEMANQFPYLDEVVVSHFQSKTNEIEAFFAGKLDLVSGITQEAAKEIMEQYSADFESKANKYVMESMGDVSSSDLFVIRKANLKGYKLNSEGTVNWANVFVK